MLKLLTTPISIYYFCVVDLESPISCPLCDSKDTTLFMDSTDYAVSGESYSLVRCNNCGLIATLNPPTEINDKYSKLNLELYRVDKPRRFFDIVYYYMRYITVRRKIRLVESKTGMRRGKLLNYGAKSGFFSSRMSDRGWTVTSLEQHYEKRMFSLEMFHHRMMDLTELDSIPKNSYDAITLWHTLEHQFFPGSLMDKLCSVLKPNGLIFVAVPNTDSFDATFYGNKWAAWDVPRHLWHFNPGSMMMFGKTHGLVLMYHRRMPFDVFFISVLSEKFRKSRWPTMKGLACGFLFWLKTNTRRDKGSSIVYVFRKKTEYEA